MEQSTGKVTGYRIVSQENQSEKQKLLQSPSVKVMFVAPQHYQIKSVVCNQKVYDIPIEATFHHDHLDNISFNQKCQKCCQILAKQIDTIKVSEFVALKKQMKNYFNIELDIDNEELFLIFISDQLQNQLNQTLDAISDVKIVNLVKMIYDNCPTKLIPKMQRKFKKYLTNSKRSQSSTKRLQTLLKLAKQSDDVQEQQQKVAQSKANTQNKVQQKRIVVQKKVQQKPIKQANKKWKEQIKNTQPKQQKTKQPKKIQEQVQKKSNRKERRKNNNNNQLENIAPVNSSTNKQQNQDDQEDWVDDDSHQWQDYTNQPKGKNSVQNIQKKPYPNKNQGKPHYAQKKQIQEQQDKSQKQHHYVRKIHKREGEDQERGDSSNNDYEGSNRRQSRENYRGQSRQNFNGRRSNNKENKNIDLRVVLGINGASQKVWRERMRQFRGPRNNENQSTENKDFQKQKEKHFVQKPSTKNQKTSKQVEKVQKKTLKKTQQKTQTFVNIQNQSKPSSSSGTGMTKIYSYPVDSALGKKFKFEKKNYNLFINNSFWVNILGNQITILKDGKGYIRSSKVEILDSGNGLMADGVTLHLDGLSNLQDGGISFGNPNFKDFLPQDGNQWFHIVAMDVYLNQ